jgi:hypothetical protein
MNIEDLVILAAMKCQMNQFDSKLIWSFHDQIARGLGFTEKQAILSVKVLQRQKSKLNEILGQDISNFLENPVFRLNKRILSNTKRISVIEHSEYGKALKVEFPYNESLVEKIRKERPTLPFAAWDKDEKAWIFALNERAICLLLSFVKTDGFVPDQEFEEYVSQVEDIQENLEKYVPMVSFTENSPKFVNVSNRVPQPTSNDLMAALFLARKSGIHTWDNNVSDYLETSNIKKSVINFLNENPGQNFAIYLEETPISDLTTIIKNLGPVLFVIPGGSELEKTTMSVNFLKELGIDTSKISVLFRLPNETGESFNRYIKNETLNNPVTNETQAVFISGKIPKTIIDSTIKFNCVVNFSIHSVHYTIREFIKNHHNVIHVLDKKPQRNLNFALL